MKREIQWINDLTKERHNIERKSQKRKKDAVNVEERKNE